MKRKTEKGITLIALVITIIILLILAGVTIAAISGDNGILKNAGKAKEETEQAEEDELRRLTALEAATYIEEHEFTDVSGEKVTIPAKCAVSQVEGENTLENGLVIIDANGNEWVWIEVPKTIYTTAKSSIDYLNIEKDIQNYVQDYRISGYEDTWYSEEQHGFKSLEDYNNYKNNMLKSIYENEGFFVSRYEVGTLTPRTSGEEELEKPVIRKGVYPYNLITCKQAQALSNQLAVGQETSSLLFGIQYDLILKFIEVKGAKTKQELLTNVTSWGNFANTEFEVEEGSYMLSELNENLVPIAPFKWTTINSKYKKINGQRVLFSTGITDRNMVLNIYDLAGNLWEWTLEGRNGNSVKRGTSYVSGAGNETGLNYRAANFHTNSNANDGIRGALY